MKSEEDAEKTEKGCILHFCHFHQSLSGKKENDMKV
jgi:hypothetical protein